jgi:hypothetical protein
LSTPFLKKIKNFFVIFFTNFALDLDVTRLKLRKKTRLILYQARGRSGEARRFAGELISPILAVGKNPLAATVAVLAVPAFILLDPAAEVVGVVAGEDFARGDVVCGVCAVAHNMYSFGGRLLPLSSPILYHKTSQKSSPFFRRSTSKSQQDINKTIKKEGKIPSSFY